MDKIKRIGWECPFSLEVIDLEFKVWWNATKSVFLFPTFMLRHTTQAVLG
jgi:hypothetical protein